MLHPHPSAAALWVEHCMRGLVENELEGLMGHTTQLEEALALALKLPPSERLRLVERVVASVEHEITRGMPSTQIPAEHWGQALNRLVDALDLSDWEALEINDPVEWVKALRRQDESRLDPYWNDSQ
jgi:hypothetical protein